MGHTGFEPRTAAVNYRWNCAGYTGFKPRTSAIKYRDYAGDTEDMNPGLHLLNYRRIHGILYLTAVRNTNKLSMLHLTDLIPEIWSFMLVEHKNFKELIVTEYKFLFLFSIFNNVRWTSIQSPNMIVPFVAQGKQKVHISVFYSIFMLTVSLSVSGVRILAQLCLIKFMNNNSNVGYFSCLFFHTRNEHCSPIFWVLDRKRKFSRDSTQIICIKSTEFW